MLSKLYLFLILLEISGSVGEYTQFISNQFSSWNAFDKPVYAGPVLNLPPS